MGTHVYDIRLCIRRPQSSYTDYHDICPNWNSNNPNQMRRPVCLDIMFSCRHTCINKVAVVRAGSLLQGNTPSKTCRDHKNTGKGYVYCRFFFWGGGGRRGCFVFVLIW